MCLLPLCRASSPTSPLNKRDPERGLLRRRNEAETKMKIRWIAIVGLLIGMLGALPAMAQDRDVLYSAGRLLQQCDDNTNRADFCMGRISGYVELIQTAPVPFPEPLIEWSLKRALQRASWSACLLPT